MHARSRLLAGAALAAAALVAGCSSKSCTQRGCQDQFHVSMGSVDHTVPRGTHVVEVTADGATLSCTFQVPLESLPGGSATSPECPWGLEVRIVPGNFFEDVTVSGKPAQVRVRLTVNGAVILDRTESPAYEEDLPNGPGCSPTCHQASVQWTFTSP